MNPEQPVRSSFLAEAAKPAYVKPEFRSEPVFETAALTCGKVVRQGANCRSTKC